MERFIFSQLVVRDSLLSKKYKDGVAALRKSVHLTLLVILVCLIALGQANAQFTQQGSKLVGTGAVGNANQGSSVSISSDGNTAIVSGINDNSSTGAAWVWTRSGGVWTQQGSKLVGTGAVGAAHQGSSVSISSDGNTAIVGGGNDNSDAGAVWVWTRSGGVWAQQGNKLVGTGAVGSAQQGWKVSLSSDGNTAIVGGTNDNSNAGAAWVWIRSGGVWSQQGSKLVGTGAVGNANQGSSVSLSSDGNTAIVSGFNDNSGVGAAWIWTRSVGVWTQQGSKLVGTGYIGNAFQGRSASISSDGNTAIVGGYGDNNYAGAMWVWTRSGGVWAQQGSKLVGSSAVGNAYQSASISLSSDGNIAIVGGYGDNSNAGAAWIWTRSGGVWTQKGSRLVGTGAVATTHQGWSVSISSDGNTAIVGGEGDDNSVGAAWIYATPNAPPVAQNWIQQTSNTSRNLWGVSFIDNNTGFVCGDNGTILKTTDGGVNWLSRSSGTTYQLAGIQFVNANIGYTASPYDNGGILLKTIDGGNTWKNISLNMSNARSGGWWFFSADTGFFSIGDTTFTKFKILKTTNGGTSWDTVYSGGTGWISFMDFPDRNNGYATVSGSTILKSTDGGAHWNSLSVGGNLWMSGVYFFNKDTGFVGGGDFNTGAGSIFKTTDGGNNWQTLTTAYYTSVMLFTSSNTGYAIGGSTISTVKKIITTTDGGATWGQDATPRERLNGISFPSANIGYAVGDSGTILKYGGVTGVSNDPTSLPSYFGLSQNYPNPFNPSTTIRYTLPSSSRVKLAIYNVLGQVVSELVNQEQSAGWREVQWKPNVASGIYFYRIEAVSTSDPNNRFVQVKKMLLLK